MIEVVVLLGTLRESWSTVVDVGVLAEVWATVQRYKASEHAFASFRGPSLNERLVQSVSIMYNGTYGWEINSNTPGRGVVFAPEAY